MKRFFSKNTIFFVIDPNVVSHSFSQSDCSILRKEHMELKGGGTKTKDPWQAFAISSNNFCLSSVFPLGFFSGGVVDTPKLLVSGNGRVMDTWCTIFSNQKALKIIKKPRPAPKTMGKHWSCPSPFPVLSLL